MPRTGRNSDALKPTASVLCKVASVVVHYEEFVSRKGHHFDKDALDALVKDDEVVAWIRQMRGLGMVPEKRDPNA